MKVLLTLISLAAAAPYIHAQALDTSARALYRQTTPQDIEERFTRLREAKNSRVTEEDQEIRIDADGSAIYTFTKPGHPAHPSMVRRGVGQRDGKVYIETTGVTAAATAAFEAWFAVFLRQDEEIRGRLKAK